MVNTKVVTESIIAGMGVRSAISAGLKEGFAGSKGGFNIYIEPDGVTIYCDETGEKCVTVDNEEAAYKWIDDQSAKSQAEKPEEGAEVVADDPLPNVEEPSTEE